MHDLLTNEDVDAFVREEAGKAVTELVAMAGNIDEYIRATRNEERSLRYVECYGDIMRLRLTYLDFLHRTTLVEPVDDEDED